MKPRNEEQKLAEAQGQTKKPRFQIEKLEERIAPTHAGNHPWECRRNGPHCQPR